MRGVTLYAPLFFMLKIIIVSIIAFLIFVNVGFIGKLIILSAIGLFLYTRIFRFKPDGSEFYVFFGLPGCGKTTTLAEITRQCIAKDIPVLSNCPILGTYEVQRSDLGEYDISPEAFDTEKDLVLIFDEASIDYFKRDFKSFEKKENQFHSLHRHFRVHEIFAAQSWDGMDLRLRELNTKLFFVSKWWFGLIRIRRIAKSFEINEDHQPIDGYEFVKFSDRFFRPNKAWKMFDTLAIPSDMHLRKKKWKLRQASADDVQNAQ